MKYCLDTNTVIYYLTGTHPAIKAHLHRNRPKNIFVPEIVVAELLYGVVRSRQKTQNAAKVETFLSPFIRIPFDSKVSPHYADIRADLSDRGKLIGPNDLLIAAITRAHSMTLVTHNTKEFGRVTGLKTADWTKE